MEAKHTPGSWKVYEDHGDMLIIGGDDGNDVASVIGSDSQYEDIRQMAKADARLIAAAPDLLEACRAADRLSVYAHNRLASNGTKDEVYAALAELRQAVLAAIARAEGR